ncbi:CNNM domain-containing protein [Kineococcus gynurae]|uniref:CNNM domain-containing protein n=1 Tax=Kineococcus gynurae TaxID=452979 RepID=A0ABV5LVB7_9ACTN
MSNPVVVTLATVLLIVGSAFFVIIEFSLLGLRRHRLEAAAGSSRSARAALRSANELTVMLAGAQLGITACTFALGAVTKPAVHHALTPLLESLGLALWIADAVAFALAMFVVTFLHLVVGEMAPKSWAIAHPETSAVATALPARVYIAIFRPLLTWVNEIANKLVARTGVEPTDTAAVGGQDAETIRHLVEHSASTGALEPGFQTQIGSVMDLQTEAVETLLQPGRTVTALPAGATVAEVQELAARTGHLRVVLLPETGEGSGFLVVHVRDTLLDEPGSRALDRARPAHVLPPATPVHIAFRDLRENREQLAVVAAEGRLHGVVTMTDVLRRVLPGDPAPVPARD